MREWWVIITLLLLSTQVVAMPKDMSASVGWHWYNETHSIQHKDTRMFQAFSQLSASDRLKVLQQATRELRAKAVLSGKVSDIADYKRAQDMWVNKATKFTVGWERMLLAHPELNYGLKYSNENIMAPVMLQHQHMLEKEAIRKIAQEYGLLYFYRGARKQDILMAKFVRQFAKLYKIHLIPVSVDGHSVEIFNHKEYFDVDDVKSSALQVHYFPALVLVNPKKGSHQIISYGLKSQNELAERFLNIERHWKADF